MNVGAVCEFESKVRHRTFGCVAMGSLVYFKLQIALVFHIAFCLDLV